MSKTSKQDSFRRVWLWPLLIAMTSTIGLISALLGDGVWDVLSWIMLGIPLAEVTAVARRSSMAG